MEASLILIYTKAWEADLNLSEEVYRDACAAYDSYCVRAFHIANLLGYGNEISDMDVRLYSDIVCVRWEKFNRWGGREEDFECFPISYLWMTDEQIQANVLIKESHV